MRGDRLANAIINSVAFPIFAGPYSLARIRWRRFGDAVVSFQRVFASTELMFPVEAGPPDGRPWEKLWRSAYFLTFRSAHAFVNWSLDHIFAYSALYPLLHCSEVGVLAAAMAEVETATAKMIANAYRMFILPVVPA